MLRWRIFSSQTWSRTLALIKSGQVLVSNLQTAGRIREAFILTETDSS